MNWKMGTQNDEWGIGKWETWVEKKAGFRSCMYNDELKLINSPLPGPLLQERELMQTEGISFGIRDSSPFGASWL